MKNKNHKKLSKFLSLVLRHRPEKIGIQLSEAGWTDVNTLLEKINSTGNSIDFELLNDIVASSDKQRFAFNEDKSQIRANQGHSIKVDLGLVAKTPPNMLYHGTAEKYLNSILEQGLKKRNRHHVHLSTEMKTAEKVGARHGKLVILKVHSGKMNVDGFEFFESENGVWLTDHVPVSYLERKNVD